MATDVCPGVVNANAATFPALKTVDMTLAYLNLGPCAALPPHYHPRELFPTQVVPSSVSDH